MREEDGYYLILLGGTGARCGEIFLHMCANGYFPGRQVNLLYIDSDLRNGNAERMRSLYQNYRACREKYTIRSGPLAGFFRTEVRMMEVNPVQGVDKFSDLAAMRVKSTEQMEGIRALMRALYTDEEYSMQISEGFFSRPSVGAALFAANMQPIMEECIARINEDQMAGKNIRIFMIGSVFGGTGASSLPTIARYLRKTMFGASTDKNIEKKLKVGASIVLPYFAFRSKSEEEGEEKENSEDFVQVDARVFTTKTRTALEYYRYLEKDGREKLFDAVYLLGHDGNEVRGWYDTAGAGQKNLPHITEFYTAMAAVSFFGGENDRGKYFAVIPEGSAIRWKSFQNHERCMISFGVMMRFALTMESLILEELFDRKSWQDDDWKLSKNAKDIPWYFDFIEGRGKLENYIVGEKALRSQLEDISEYCRRYVRWFAELFAANLDKLKFPDEVSFPKKGKAAKAGAGDDSEEDFVPYLDLFRIELVWRQHVNNEMNSSFPPEYPADKKERIYKENLKYIRKNADKLFECKEIKQNGKSAKNVGFEMIWSRMNALGSNHMRKESSGIRNLDNYTEQSMEESIRNLVNAVYIACLI